MIELHRPTEDVESTVDYLLDRGFEMLEIRGGASASFGDQLIRLSDGSSEVTITRDRGQWGLTLQPDSWLSSSSLDLVLAVMDGSYRTPPSRDDLPEQLPVGVRWTEAVPAALEWACAGRHREVIAEAGGWHRSNLLFGTLMGRPSIDEFGVWFEVLSSAVGAKVRDLPTLGGSGDQARPHIEHQGDRFAFVVVERGVEFTRSETSDALEILALSFLGVTFGLASRWELEHRHPTGDSRRRLFAKQLVLLETLHPPWARRRASELGPHLAEAGLDAADAHRVVTEATVA